MESQQESILQVASRLFEQYGIRSVSIDNVCSELRISKKTFYTYFPQKEDLVEAVIHYQRDNERERYQKMFKNKNAIDSLILIIKEIKKHAILEPSPTMCYDIEKYYPKVFERNEQAKIKFIREGFEKNLRQGIEEGFYREDLDVELISIFHSVQIRNTFSMMTQEKFSKKRLIDFFIDVIVHIIASEKGLKYLEENYNNIN